MQDDIELFSSPDNQKARNTRKSSKSCSTKSQSRVKQSTVITQKRYKMKIIISNTYCVEVQNFEQSLQNQFNTNNEAETSKVASKRKHPKLSKDDISFSIENTIHDRVIYWESSLNNEHENDKEKFVMFCIPNELFIQSLIESADGINFSALEKFLFELSNRIKSTLELHNTLKLILGLFDFDKSALKFQMDNRNGKHSIHSLKDNAIAFLIYSLDIEVICWKNVEDLTMYIKSISSTILEAKGRAESCDLDFAIRTKTLKPDETISPSAKHLFELSETWAAMLQAIPMISREKAHSLTSDLNATCPLQLYKTLTNSEIPTLTRQLQFQTSFCGKITQKGVRNEAKLSKLLFRIMTKIDSKETLDE